MKKLWLIAATLSLLSMSLASCKAFMRWRGGVEKEAIVYSGRSQAGNYEWYFDQYHACKAAAQKVRFADSEREANQIRMVLSSMVEEYNSRSRMQWTRATWKPNELPYQIDMEDLLK